MNMFVNVFNSSTNAYMLMYRLKDTSRNASKRINVIIEIKCFYVNRHLGISVSCTACILKILTFLMVCCRIPGSWGLPRAHKETGAARERIWGAGEETERDRAKHMQGKVSVEICFSVYYCICTWLSRLCSKSILAPYLHSSFGHLLMQSL